MIPRYTVGALLGRGGSGAVYEGVQRSTGRAVAIKVLDVFVTDQQDLARFTRERDAMAALATHPHVVAILNAGITDGRLWIAMDLHRQGSLVGPLDVAEVLFVLRGVASALAAAHAVGVLHCDVKPASVLVDDHGRPVLSDFGIARLGLGSGATGAAYTLDHAAPEVLSGGRPGPASDVWSLGMTAWQLLSGRAPFRRADDASPAVVIGRIATAPLPDLDVPVPPRLVSLLHEMTAKDPAARPSASAVLDWAQAIAAGTNAGAVPPSGVAAAMPAPAATWATDHRPDLAELTRAAPGVSVSIPEQLPAPGRRVPATLLAGLAVGLAALAAVVVVVTNLLATTPPSAVVPAAAIPSPAVVLPPAPTASAGLAAVDAEHAAPSSTARARARVPRSTLPDAVVAPTPSAVAPPAVAPPAAAPPVARTMEPTNSGDNNGDNGNNGGDGGALLPDGF